jgi:hypothetical protein
MDFKMSILECFAIGFILVAVVFFSMIQIDRYNMKEMELDTYSCEELRYSLEHGESLVNRESPLGLIDTKYYAPSEVRNAYDFRCEEEQDGN